MEAGKWKVESGRELTCECPPKDEVLVGDELLGSDGFSDMEERRVDVGELGEGIFLGGD
jgi:hypothetical protein